MSHPCHHCGNPLTGHGFTGRTGASYCCFGCLNLGERPPAAASRRGLDWLAVRLGFAVLVVGQSMMFGLALNLHDDVPAEVRWYAQSAILGATVLVIGLLGGPLLRAAWQELRRGRLTIEALFLLTLAGALGASLQAHLTGRGAIYFEVVSVLLVVYTLGKMIGARSRAAAVAAAGAWSEALSVCRLVDEKGLARTVPVREVRAGDRIEVNPGEMIAVDGVVLDGTGFVSEAAVSGEPFAVVRRPGDRVLAGAASHDATFHIEASVAGSDRQVDRLLQAVEAARRSPLSFQSRADALGRMFLPFVLFTALTTFGYWALLTPAGWEVGLFNAMSVLLVACPCVIGLATPIVIWTALNQLAERGLIVRSGDAVERLAAVDCVVFDKTGTLTEDRFTIVDIATTANGSDRARLIGWLAAVERRSPHPIAKAFAALPVAHEPIVRAVRAVPGLGVVAELEDGGVRHTLQIGRPEWFEAASASVEGTLVDSLVTTEGHRIDVAVDGERAAVAIVAERLRDSTPETLAAFGRMKLPVEVLTGDTAERAAILQVPETRANLLPEGKHRRIEELRAVGRHPLVIGDGINDASALAAAHVGVALSSGTDLAVGAAAITLYHGDLRVLPWAVGVSRAAVRAVKGNLRRAVAYNLIGMALAAAGVLHPIAAALLMTLSSLSLVFSATRVGAGHCEEAVTADRAWPWCVHAIALAAQGAVLALLLGLSPFVAACTVLGFTAAGVGLAWGWQRWPAIPHTLDMAFGMLTLGNLGMVLGWWLDLGFEPVHCARCCSCAEPLAKPGMWLGMLLFANAAMLALARRPTAFSSNHRIAMFTGGNVGMLLGMFAGGAAVATIDVPSAALFGAMHFAGMTAGMIAGMLIGTWALEHVLGMIGLLTDRLPANRGDQVPFALRMK